MSSSSSTPISILMSEPIAINSRPRHIHSGRQRSSSRRSNCSSSSSDQEDDRDRDATVFTAQESTDSFGELHVGSLPMHLRRSGRARDWRQRQRQRQLSDGASSFFGPQSLPPPKAPFLSSKGGPDGKLSSMPDIALPESATYLDPELPSVPYGSLRESKFIHRGVASTNVNYSIANSENEGLSDLFNRNTQMPMNLSSNKSLIGDLLEDSQGYMKDNHAQSNMVDGLAEKCARLELEDRIRHGSRVPHNNNTRFQNSRSDFHSDTHVSNALSSSLTTLDILKRIRQTSTVGDGEVASRLPNDANAEERCCHSPGLRQPAQSAGEWSPSHGTDNNDQNANPDTYETFDLELDDE